MNSQKKELIKASFTALIIIIGIFVSGTILLNYATDGRLFAKTLECPDGTWKVYADEFTPSGDNWQIQPGGSYAKCVYYVPDPNYITLNSEITVYFDDLPTHSNSKIVVWEGNMSTIPSTIKYEIPRNKTYKITFSINESDELPFNPDHWHCYDINNNEIPCTAPLSNDTVMIIV